MKWETKKIRSELININFTKENNINNSNVFNLYNTDICFFIFNVKINNSIICKSYIPVKHIHEGLRSLPLYDMDGQIVDYSVILANVSILT